MTQPNTCGGCGSANLNIAIPYAVCNDCSRLQELETRPNPAAQLCDNCACRPDSPERADPYGWLRWEERHIEDGIPFNCHKGLAVDILPSGEAYAVGSPENTKEAMAQPCAGWLARRKAYLMNNQEAFKCAP